MARERARRASPYNRAKMCIGSKDLMESRPRRRCSLDSASAVCVTPGAAFVRAASADVFDDCDELVYAVALASGEFDEFPRSRDDRAALGRAGDRDAAPTPELQQPFVTEQA